MKVILLSFVEGCCEAPECGRGTRKIYGTADGWRGRACCASHAHAAVNRELPRREEFEREGAEGSVQDERKGPSLP